MVELSERAASYVHSQEDPGSIPGDRTVACTGLITCGTSVDYSAGSTPAAPRLGDEWQVVDALLPPHGSQSGK